MTDTWRATSSTDDWCCCHRFSLAALTSRLLGASHMCTIQRWHLAFRCTEKCAHSHRMAHLYRKLRRRPSKKKKRQKCETCKCKVGIGIVFMLLHSVRAIIFAFTSEHENAKAVNGRHTHTHGQRCVVVDLVTVAFVGPFHPCMFWHVYLLDETFGQVLIPYDAW